MRLQQCKARQSTDLLQSEPAPVWPRSTVYRSCEIGPSLTIDFVALPTTAALDNSHHMDFSINPQINICGREYTTAGYGQVSWLPCCGSEDTVLVAALLCLGLSRLAFALKAWMQRSTAESE